MSNNAHLLAVTLAGALLLGACMPGAHTQARSPASITSVALADAPFVATPVATFNEPWALSFLPDGRMLVTEKPGNLLIVTRDGEKSAPVAGLPDVDVGGQGGLGDVIQHPDFARNSIVYLSYAEAGADDTRGAAVARAVLQLDSEGGGQLSSVNVIWRQVPKVSGRGHYGHRLAFDARGYLFITSGERQKFDPAQDLQQNLGKIIRLHEDGAVPAGNPFAAQGGVAAEVWSLGHRNPLGINFDGAGRLWVHEMGPAGGDELNLIRAGGNYGYPLVSYGDHYSGRSIPDHDTRPDLDAPAAWWVPAISPAGFLIYDGDLFPAWIGDGLIGGLSSRALVRIAFNGEQASEVERYDMDARIREVAQAPDGAIWLLEDGAAGRLLRLSPRATP